MKVERVVCVQAAKTPQIHKIIILKKWRLKILWAVVCLHVKFSRLAIKMKKCTNNGARCFDAHGYLTHSRSMHI